jgi:hypothetical protein
MRGDELLEIALADDGPQTVHSPRIDFHLRRMEGGAKEARGFLSACSPAPRIEG